MKFKIDHDYHIHSKLSVCSKDPEQTAENILRYAERNNFSEIVVTDHFWDSAVGIWEGAEAGSAGDFYNKQDYEHIASILKLPQSESVRFRFGCETELDKDMRLGISDKTIDKFDFIVIPTTHMHMRGVTVGEQDVSVEEKAYLYVERLNYVMSQDLPFEKIGIAHLTCPHICFGNWKGHLEVLDLISDSEFRELFSKIAKKGAGFELNFVPNKYTQEELKRVLRPYKLAKEVGCKFYMGSDSHHPQTLNEAPQRFSDIVNLLELDEKDRFYIP